MAVPDANLRLAVGRAQARIHAEHEVFCGARPRLRGFNLPTTNASVGS